MLTYTNVVYSESGSLTVHSAQVRRFLARSHKRSEVLQMMFNYLTGSGKKGCSKLPITKFG